MCSYSDIVNNNIETDEKCYTYHIQWPYNKVVRAHYKVVRAPSSIVYFWIKRLHLGDNSDIVNFDDEGYSCLNEIISELTGFYQWYEHERYVQIFKKYYKNIEQILYKYRYMPLIDRSSNQPIFNIKSRKYLKHKAIEIKPTNTQILFNNGIASNVLRSGTNII